ncbi:MAG TPA: glycosyltransferase family 2 protein [Saprospiraceae bacterium]|nr:glycosyltransferase family 2 protein [Saprospiraceae bacterium]
MTTLDIILPAYNPMPGWEDIVVTRFLSLTAHFPMIQCHLIIVNDGSTTINELQSCEKIKSEISNFLWIRYSDNKGKGYALRMGVKASTSDLILYTDIDWPYTEDSMIGFIEKLITADVVIGIRDKSYYAKLPGGRILISMILKFFNAKFLKLIVDDTQAGLKGFKKNIKTLFLSTTIDRYLFDLEFIHLLSKSNKFAVKTFPIYLREGITFSKMNRKFLIREARNFFKLWMKS